MVLRGWGSGGTPSPSGPEDGEDGKRGDGPSQQPLREPISPTQHHLGMGQNQCWGAKRPQGLGMPCWDPAHLTLSPLPGVTYSDTVSATEPCKPCTQCVGLQSMSAPCVESDDAVCRCAYGYYQDEPSGSCKECRVCEVGFGLMFPCQDSQDTVCEECPEGTFSSEANFVDPCLPCTTCEENEVMVKECTAISDAECRGNVNFFPGRAVAEGRVGFIGTPVALPASVSLCATAMGRQGHVPGLGGENLGVPLRPPALGHCSVQLPTKAALAVSPRLPCKCLAPGSTQLFPGASLG